MPKFLTSRKFWATAAGLAAVILVETVPTLAPYQDSIGEILFTLAAYVVGTGIADAGRLRKG